jgi:hypothetical protein
MERYRCDRGAVLPGSDLAADPHIECRLDPSPQLLPDRSGLTTL